MKKMHLLRREQVKTENQSITLARVVLEMETRTTCLSPPPTSSSAYLCGCPLGSVHASFVSGTPRQWTLSMSKIQTLASEASFAHCPVPLISHSLPQREPRAPASPQQRASHTGWESQQPTSSLRWGLTASRKQGRAAGLGACTALHCTAGAELLAAASSSWGPPMGLPLEDTSGSTFPSTM